MTKFVSQNLGFGRPVPDLHEMVIMNTVAGAALDFHQLPSLTAI
jgi:hypothetical protein